MQPDRPPTVPGMLIVGTLLVLFGIVAGAAYARFAIAGLLTVIGVALITTSTRSTRQ